jgi:RNA-directed DNA polymerase
MELLEGKMSGTSGPASVSTKLQKVAELARQAPEMVFTTLAHHIDLDLLREAYRRTRKEAAEGVDGQTAEQYAKDLERNLEQLLNRFKTGTYKAPPVRRAYIPKGDGTNKSECRPIGIPTFEDKVLQRAVVMVLEAVYEQDFLDCSYAFRPGRSAHDALQRCWQVLMEVGGGYVLEIDIEKFFDNLEPKHLRGFLDQRVRDGDIRRAIDKWLKAGVIEGGKVHHPSKGTPQGGVVSPLLSNIYLHEVLDKWFDRQVRPRLTRKAELIRFADDVIVIFASETDAKKVMKVLPKRLGRYGLNLHPTKTRIVQFRRPRQKSRKDGPQGPGTFDLLGFTHYWVKSQKGNWVVTRKTAKDRFSRSIKRVAQWCRRNRHLPVRDQQRVLTRKLIGHYQYYGITGNSRALTRFHYEVRRVWRKWLGRRSDGSGMSWERFVRMVARYPLPRPIAVHSMLRHAASP